MELFKGDRLFILHYEPEIYVDIVEVISVHPFHKYSNENLYRTLDILSGQKDKCNMWLEKTLNLNKLIKQKHNKRFISVNEELIIKRLKILLQYAPKKKEI